MQMQSYRFFSSALVKSFAQQQDARRAVGARWRCGVWCQHRPQPEPGQVRIALTTSPSGKAAAPGPTLTPKTVEKGGKRKATETKAAARATEQAGSCCATLGKLKAGDRVVSWFSEKPKAGVQGRAVSLIEYGVYTLHAAGGDSQLISPQHAHVHVLSELRGAFAQEERDTFLPPSLPP
eukprot:320954-Rhodomonas_salina.1